VGYSGEVANEKISLRFYRFSPQLFRLISLNQWFDVLGYMGFKWENTKLGFLWKKKPFGFYYLVREIKILTSDLHNFRIIGNLIRETPERCNE